MASNFAWRVALLPAPTNLSTISPFLKYLDAAASIAVLLLALKLVDNFTTDITELEQVYRKYEKKFKANTYFINAVTKRKKELSAA